MDAWWFTWQGGKSRMLPLQLDDLPEADQFNDTAVSDTKPFPYHISASSITHTKILHCPLHSYTGAI